MTAWLDPGRWLLLLCLVGALALGVWRLDESRQQIGYDRAVAEYAKAAAKQTATNAASARAAEVRYVDREVLRTEFLTITQKELSHVAENLAVCSLDPGAVRLLNHAATCASHPSTATCGSGDPVPATQ